ncbi:MAG: hypothetical protein VBE63_20825 [Lamprobacter sp.]|uniref:hypothetical protein n=1 Tax=Lamprobacter sp. TaxID=3100796 RepID=UPI002B260D11|nr:hypothetical protein [Lamprobacter sp.]MEA3642363.1 hypothetical protein [Lamprobacter sp.]
MIAVANQCAVSVFSREVLQVVDVQLALGVRADDGATFTGVEDLGGNYEGRTTLTVDCHETIEDRVNRPSLWG